jgi:hypothetical protein
MREAPYSFEIPAYAGCYTDDLGAGMDVRHVYMLHDILRLGWENPLEIGCFNGASSTAFIEALNAGRIARATFCEVCVRKSLASVLRNAKYPDQTRLTLQPSWQLLDVKESFDLIFLDAAHDLETVSLETAKLLRRRPKCLLAHDTSATAAGYGYCEGARFLKDTFVAQADYYCIEDNAKRDGELTDRGLFLATTDVGIYEKAKAVFAEWGN